MKKLNSKLRVAAFLLLTLFIISGCEKDEDPNEPIQGDPVAPKEVILDEELTMPNLDILNFPEVTEMSIENEFSIISDGIPSDEELGSPEGCVKKKGGNDCKLKALGLTEEQKKKLFHTIEMYNKCRKYQYMMLKKINKDIIEKGNAERMKIIQKYKKGEITKEQMKTAIQKLNARIKQALKTNPQKLQIIRNLKLCFQKYIASVKLILTQEQWKKWVNLNHKKHNKGKGKKGNGKGKDKKGGGDL